ncbi:MAG: hypothetical protein AAB692_04910 [Patescibacteria group bacterium]
MTGYLVENFDAFFSGRIDPLFSPSDRHFIRGTYEFSKAGHRGQTRKEIDGNGQPVRYFEHPRRTALIVLDELRLRIADVVVLALIHDGAEDTELLNLDFVERWYGKAMAERLRLVTKPEKPWSDKYVERLLAYGDWITLMVKACDHLDNRRTLGHCDRAFQVKQITETEQKYYAVLDRLVAITPRRHQYAAEYLRAEIRKIVEEYKALFAAGNGAPEPRP